MQYIGKKQKYNKINVLFAIVYLINGYLIISNLCSIYNMKNIIFNARFSTWIMGLMLIISAFCFFINVINRNKFPLIIWISAIFAFWTVLSTLFNYSIQKDNIFITLANQLFWWSTLILGYLAFRKGKKAKSMKITVGGLFFAVFILYMQYVLNINKYVFVTPNMVNSYYYCLLFLPFVLTIKKTYIKNIFIGLIMFAALLSMKRTAFLAIILSLMVNYSVMMLISGRSIRKKIRVFFYFFIVAALSFIFYDFIKETYNLDILLRFKSIEIDGGSGRNFIYKSVWYELIEFDFAFWLIGKGYNGVLLNSSIGLSAHNDFLEVLYDYGLIGLILYTIFIAKLIKYGIDFIKTKHVNADAYAASLMIFFTISMASHLIIYPTYFMLLILFWAWQIGGLESSNNNVKVMKLSRIGPENGRGENKSANFSNCTSI